MRRKILSLCPFLFGAGGVAIHVFSIPGYVDNANTWLKWSKAFLEPSVQWFSLGFFLASILYGLIILAYEGWHLRFLRVFKKHRKVVSLESPRLNAYRAPDGSITLEQAAFLWLDTPKQVPVPPEVQDRIEIFRNAIDQGTLKRHLRHDEETEKNFAALRFLFGNPTPIDTRLMPSELRRWAESVGDLPEFLSQ